MGFARFLPERHLVVALIVACALFMENLDSTIIATALPAIAHALHDDPIRLNMAITSYLLSLAVFIPISGWVADRYGARTVFKAAIVVFLLGSVGCGLSQSLFQLVVMRILQGLGGAMMVPVGRLVVLRAVPKNDLVRAMSYLTVPGLLGPVLGPPVGGFIVTFSDWRWIFFINVPIGIIGMFLAHKYLENSKMGERRPLDMVGFVLSGAGLAGIVFGFDMVGRGAVPVGVIMALLVGGLLCSAFYVLHSRHKNDPIVDLSLFRIPTFKAAFIGGTFFRLSIGATPFLLPMMLQLGFGLSAFKSGGITFAGAVGAMLMKFTAKPVVRHFGFRRVLMFNTWVCVGFIVCNALFTAHTPHWLIVAILLVGGFFRSLQFTSLNTLGYADVTHARMSRATSLASMMQQVARSLGVGIGALALQVTLMLRHGDTLAASDFAPAFIVIAALALVSLLFFVKLQADAGAEVSGHENPRKQILTQPIHPSR